MVLWLQDRIVNSPIVRTNLNPQQEYRRHNQHPRFQHLQDFLFWDLECIQFSIYSTSVKAHFDQTKIGQIGISGPSVRQSQWDCFFTWSHQSELMAANLSTSDWLSDDHRFINRCVLFIEFNKIVIPRNYKCSNQFFLFWMSHLLFLRNEVDCPKYQCFTEKMTSNDRNESYF